MFEIRELHGQETDRAFQDWARMLRAACRMLVLNAGMADAVRVSATFENYGASLDAADMVTRIVEEYSLSADTTVTTYVSTRISRPRQAEGRHYV